MSVTIKLETKKFNDTLKKFMAKSDLSAEKVIKKTAFDLLAHILGKLPGENNFGLSIKALAESKGKTITGRHPVDTGRARAAWYPSIQGLGGSFDFNALGTTGKIDSKMVEKGKTEGAFENRLKDAGLKYVDLINGVHYIMSLEYGKSMQAPAGMVRISMRNLWGQMPAMMEKEFIEEWNKLDL